MGLAETLKYERLKRGMTQEEFSKFLGIDRPSLTHYEAGRIPKPQRIKKFGELLGTDLAKVIIKEGEE